MYMCYLAGLRGGTGLLFIQAITKGFFAEFPQPVKEAAESIVKARYVHDKKGKARYTPRTVNYFSVKKTDCHERELNQRHTVF